MDRNELLFLLYINKEEEEKYPWSIYPIAQCLGQQAKLVFSSSSSWPANKHGGGCARPPDMINGRLQKKNNHESLTSIISCSDFLFYYFTARHSGTGYRGNLVRFFSPPICDLHAGNGYLRSARLRSKYSAIRNSLKKKTSEKWWWPAGGVSLKNFVSLVTL